MFVRFGERRREEPPAPSYAALTISVDPRSSTSTGRGGSALMIAERLKRDLRGDRLTIDELSRLRPGDHVFVRREIYGPPWEWFGALLIRIGTHTRKDKRPTVVNHNAIVIRPIREVDAGMISERRLIPADLHLLDQLDLYYDLRAGGDPDVRFTRAEGDETGGFIETIELPDDRGPIVDYLIGEALGRGGYQINRLLESYGDERRYSIAVARHRHARREHREKIVDACEHLLGKTYGYLKIGAHGGDFALTVLWNALGGRGDVYLLRRLCRMERYPMCSWSSLYAFEKAGLPFETSVETGSPDDLWDESRRRSLGVWLWPFCSRSLKSALFGSGFADDFQGLKLRDAPLAGVGFANRYEGSRRGGRSG